ncbi:hypothetical protein A3A66_01785 [Microgenomates group bacterium RIFCSPLOWO2_01_FULL_46_13]|nr:MAG: hypothetical protein A3A66_01785 [Microgenomates group bacterium RIFCSPLOWO2_01_FULL_46_13]
MSRIKDSHYFKSLANELDSKLGRLNPLIKNRNEIGRYHEDVLKHTLFGFLPKRFSLKTGFIYFDKEHVSNQLDIIVVDESAPPSYLINYGDFVIVYPDSVVCVIEVKTRLNQREFTSSTKLIQKVKQLGLRQKKMIGGLIFAFSGVELNPRTLHIWYKNVTLSGLDEYADLILCLKQGMITKWNIRDISKKGHYFILGDDDTVKWKSLAMFVSTVIKFCDFHQGETDRNPYELFSYIENMKISNEFLRYGVGLMKP